MSQTEQEIYDDIVAHADKEGSAYSNWYAGVASDPRKRLFTDHNVSEKDSWWIYREAKSSEHARNVEQELLDLGFDGGPGGGDESTKYVYAYRKISKVTNP